MNLNLLMTNLALAVRENGTYEPFSAEAWKYAGEMTLLGMGMIFCVLALLWGVLAIFKVIFVGKTPKAPKAPKEPKAKENKSQPAPSEAVSDDVAAVIAAGIQAVQEDEARDQALIAVLTAAVAAYRSEEGADGAFRVVSFKRAGGGRAWNGRK